MSEEIDGLKELARLRHNRPTYARVISWELSKPQRNEEKETGCQNNSATTRSSESDSSEDGDESEDYFSTEENPVAGASDECLNDFEAETSPSDGEQAECKLHPLRKPSTKRKQKWKRKLAKDEYDAPFSHIDTLATDFIEDVVEVARVRHDGASMNLFRTVPTLSQLCLRVNSLHQKNMSLSDIPAPGVQRLVKVYNQNESIRSLQLAWLHKILQFYEHCSSTACMGVSDNWGSTLHPDWLTFEKKKNDTDCHSLYIPVCRSIWSRPYSSHVDATIHPITLIPTTELLFLKSESHYLINSIQNISALADIIDIMLPPILYFPENLNTAIDTEKPQEKTIKTALWRVRHTLNSRYPNMVKHFFDHAVPYVWWKRGKIDVAEEFFLDSIQNIDESEEWNLEVVLNYYSHHIPARSKILKLVEIGRMFIMVGEPVRATRLFYQAFDISCDDKFLKQSKEINEVQFKALVATSFDAGLLTSKKRELSLQMWNEVLSLRHAHEYLSVHLTSFTSLMTYHLSGIEEKSRMAHLNKIEELQKLGHTHPMVDLGVALLRAISGDSEDSRRAHRNWITGPANLLDSSGYFMATLPGEQFNPNILHPAAFNPWQPLVDQAVAQGRAIPLLKMIWRTPFGHPYLRPDPDYNFPPESLADNFIEKDAKLRFSDDGFLTGDFEMLLPPIHNPKLDPYTGEVDLTSEVGRRQNVWHSISDGAPVATLLPRVTRIHENVDRNVAVDLIQSHVRYSDTVCLGTCHCCLLEWKGPGGQREKLDLKKIVKLEKKKMIECEIRKNHQRKCPHDGSYEYSSQWCSDMLDMLQMHYEYGWDFNYLQLCNEVTDKRKPPATVTEKQKKTGKYRYIGKRSRYVARWFQKHPATTNAKSKPKHLFILKIDDIRCICDTVILTIAFPSKTSPRGWIAMLLFIDCSTPTSFHDVNVKVVADARDSHRSWNSLSLQVASESRTVMKRLKKSDPGAEVILMFDSPEGSIKDETHYLRTCIFDKHGQVLQQFDIEDRPHLIGSHLQHFTKVIGSFLYGIHPTDKRLICNRITSCIKSDLLFVEEIRPLKILGKNLLVPTSSGLFACDANLNLIPWLLPSTSNLETPEDFGSLLLRGPLNAKCKVLATQTCGKPLSDLPAPVTRALVGFDDKLLVIEVPLDESAQLMHVILEVKLPGWVRGGTFISDHMGYVVTSTLHSRHDSLYYENIYHISPDGVIKGIIPLVRGINRYFMVAHLSAKPALCDKHPELPYSEGGWYLYFYDGMGAICCAELGHV